MGLNFLKIKNPFEFFWVTIEIGYNCKARHLTRLNMCSNNSGHFEK